MNVPTIAKANITSSYLIDATDENAVGINELLAEQKDPSLQGDVKVDIYTIAGQHVPSLHQLPAGPYIVRYTDAQGNSITRKYIKK